MVESFTIPKELEDLVAETFDAYQAVMFTHRPPEEDQTGTKSANLR